MNRNLNGTELSIEQMQAMAPHRHLDWGVHGESAIRSIFSAATRMTRFEMWARCELDLRTEIHEFAPAPVCFVDAETLAWAESCKQTRT